MNRIEQSLQIARVSASRCGFPGSIVNHGTPAIDRGEHYQFGPELGKLPFWVAANPSWAAILATIAGRGCRWPWLSRSAQDGAMLGPTLRGATSRNHPARALRQR